MKFRWMAGVWLAVTLLGAGGCATTSETNYENSATISDSDVEHDAQDRLRSDPITSKQTFGVAVQSGVATLTGSIKNTQARARALNIVAGTPGVTEVIDRMYR